MELALTPDSQWDYDTATLVDAARQAGFSALGLFMGRVDTGVVTAFSDAGLRCHELLGLVVTDDTAATIAWAERLAADAACIGAPWISTTFKGPQPASSSQLIERCAAMFSEAGAVMAVEFSPLGPVPTIRAGLEVVAAAGPGRAGLVIDSWNFAASECSWHDLAQVPLDKIAYIQFADALAPISDDRTDEALNRRAMPGDGVLELDRFAATLVERGWDGVVSMQVLSRELRELPLPEFARLAHDSAARFWR